MSDIPARLGAAILGCEGLRLTADEKRFFSNTQPTGFILFARNVDTAGQLRALCAELRDSVGWRAPILIDQEGGRVQRLRPPLARDWLPPMEHVARAGANAARAMYLRGRLIADDVMRYGIDVNCVPTLDVARHDTHPVLRNRCFGEAVETVVTMGQALVRGHMDGGVLPVVKHMPGHGRAIMDSHLELPRIKAPKEELQAIDFAAFKPFATLPLGMTAHLVFEAYDDRPATISECMIALIRNEIGFEGLLMTDDISMEALSGTVAERGAAALAAGCDVVLHCNGDLDEMKALVARCGDLRPASYTRAKAAFSGRAEPDAIDIPVLEAELEALTA